MLTRDFAARVGRMQYETRQIAVCTRRLGEAQDQIETLKKHRIRTDTLANIYNDRVANIPTEWFGEPIGSIRPSPVTKSAIAHAVSLYSEYYEEVNKKKQIDADISRHLLTQYELLRDVDELRVSIATGIAELSDSAGPADTIGEILKRSHECLAESAKLTEYLGGIPVGIEQTPPPRRGLQ
jgi:hypothetical protein